MRESDKSIIRLECNSIVLGELPQGCVMCRKGGKAVVFITGLCPVNCFYCPISFERKGRDVTYINESKVSSIEDVIAEIEQTQALGCSITGGEPLVVIGRVIEYIETLKSYFGSKFHIHLYTSAYRIRRDDVRRLWRAGLDEIRFHIVYLKSTLRALEYAIKNTSMDVGVEIPVIPSKKEFYKKLLKTLDNIGVKFINLNELEITESNYDKLLLRGFKARSDYPVGVEGSESLAIELVEWAKENLKSMSVHYCSALFKDAIQTRRRLLRSALFLKEPYEDITEEGLLRKLIIRGSRNIILTLYDILAREIGKDKVKLIKVNEHYEIHTSRCAIKLILKLNGNIRYRLRIFEVEEYPTSDRIRVLEEPYTLK